MDTRFKKGSIPWNKGLKVPRFTDEEKKAKQKEYYQNNKDAFRIRYLAWKKANPEKVSVYAKKSRQKNKARVNAENAKRHTEKLNRIPKWLTKDDLWLIKEAYKLAQLRSELFGFEWHVDHIIPLQGKNVSGLHIITNLQVIPGKENLLKANSFKGFDFE